MDFTEAEQKRTLLSGQLSRGQITRDQYMAAINALRVTDPQGRWWQPDPGGPGWLAWNGSAWSPATPPSGTVGLQPGTAKNFVEFRSRLMTVDEFKKMSKEVPLAKRPQKWWDLLSILGGIASAILWLLYSGIREGFDFLTPLLMIGIPVFMIWFREDLDVILLPLQPHRKNINKFLLVGIGMAFPFLIAFILFTIGIREYPLMQWNLIIGTFGAYAITRNTVISMPGTAAQPGSGKPPAPVPQVVLIVLLVALCRFLILPVRADDCPNDLLNLNDCMRTRGYAEGISGTFSTGLSTAVNGQEVVRTLSTGGTGTTGTGTTGTGTTGTGTTGTGTTGTGTTGTGTTGTGTTGTGTTGTGTTGTGTSSGPDSLPVNPDDVQNIDEVIREQPPSPPAIPPVTPPTEPPITPPTEPPVTPPTEPPITPPTEPPVTPPTEPPVTPPTEPPVTPPTEPPVTPPTEPPVTPPTEPPVTPPTEPPVTPPTEPPVTPPTEPPVTPPTEPPVTPPTEPPVTPPTTSTHPGGSTQDLAAAAAAAGTAAAGTTVTPPGIDPNTGRRILTPEQEARRDFLRGEIEKNAQEAADSSSWADWLGYAETGCSVIEKTADIAIDVGSVLSPGAGSRIKNIYGATKTILKGASESYADGEGITKGLIKGGAEAAVDKVLDVAGGKIADRFQGRIPGFGKYEAPDGFDAGDLSMGQIRDRLRGAAVPDTGDAIQNIRNIATQRLETSEALTNAGKNALQGQAQSWALWDRIKQAVGVTKPD